MIAKIFFMDGFPFHFGFFDCFVSGSIKNPEAFPKAPGHVCAVGSSSATSHRPEACGAIAGRPGRIIYPGDQHSTTHAASPFFHFVPEHCPYLLSNGLTAVYHH
jgi:hypothetical protein